MLLLLLLLLLLFMMMMLLLLLIVLLLWLLLFLRCFDLLVVSVGAGVVVAVVVDSTSPSGTID